MSASFRRMANVTAATKRAPALAGGKRGAVVTQIAELRCTPLDPLESEIRERIGTRAPIEALQCWVDADLDILPGDYLVVSGVDYPIRAVEAWAWRGSAYHALVLEQVKP